VNGTGKNGILRNTAKPVNAAKQAAAIKCLVFPAGCRIRFTSQSRGALPLIEIR
jgi:hypothetical protein